MPTWTQVNDPAASWTQDADPSSSWAASQYFLNGRPIGLLLSLTYHFSAIPTNIWTVESDPSSSWTVV